MRVSALMGFVGIGLILTGEGIFLTLGAIVVIIAGWRIK